MSNKTDFSNGVIVVLVLYCLCPNMVAQEGSSSTLPQFLFPGFIKSDVLMKNGESHSAFFNYHIVEEEMIFDQKGVYMVMAKPGDVDTIYINDRKFVPVEKAFYEVILNKPIAIYIQHKGKYSSIGTATAYGMTSQTNQATTITNMRAGNQIRTLDMPDDVQVSPAMVYWVRVNDSMEKFTSEKQFLKIFPGKEAEFKDFLKKNKLNIKEREDLVKLGIYCNEIVK